jgi:hypothetical protein
MASYKDTIGNRTCDLPCCRAVPQPTAPPRVALRMGLLWDCYGTVMGLLWDCYGTYGTVMGLLLWDCYGTVMSL